MKNLSLFIYLLISLLGVHFGFAQAPTLDSPSQEPISLEAKILQHQQMLEEQIAVPVGQSISSSAHKTTAEIQVLDSTYLYGDGLELLQRSLYPAYNPQGFSENRVTYSFDSLTSTWIPQDSTQNKAFAFSGGFWFISERVILAWDTASAQWQDTLRYFLNNDQLQNLVNQNPFFKFVSTYNSIGEVATRTFNIDVNSMGQYSPLSKDIFTYDADSNMVEFVTQYWKETSMQFEDSIRGLNTYNAAGLLATGVRELWVNGSWAPTAKTDYSYSSTGRTTLLESSVWEQMDWRLSSRTTYAYDANDELIQLTEQFYNASSDSLENSSRNNYTPNPNGPSNLEIITQLWDSESEEWKNSSRQTNTFSASNFFLTQQRSNWIDSTSMWQVSTLRTNTYDTEEEDNLLTSVFELYVDTLDALAIINMQTNTYDAEGYRLTSLFEVRGTDAELDTASYEVFYYSPFTAVGLSDMGPSAIQVYPNPAYSTLTLGGAQAGEVHILDAAGREVKLGQVTPLQRVISVEDLQPGLYHLLLIGEKGKAFSTSFYRE